MKTINLKTLACGPDGNFTPGIRIVADEFAKALVASGSATYVNTPAKAVIESAAMELPATETADLPAPKPKRFRRGGDEA